jgi:hypothetical protein
MTKINIKDLDTVFDSMKVLNRTKPDEWRKQIVSQLTNNDGIDEFRDLAKMKAIIQNFVEEHGIWVEETIYQTDRVIINAYDFIRDLVEIVGYKKDDDADNK